MVWTSIASAQTLNGWTEVPNATVPVSILGGGGTPMGLLMALTYSDTTSVYGVPWTNVANQTSGGWTSVITQNN